MNVPEVTNMYECPRTVIQHLESSVKNKEALDQCMSIFEMTSLDPVSWCQTCMVHFLKTCDVFDGMLAGVYDIMYTGSSNYYKIAICDQVHVPKFWRTYCTWANTKKHVRGIVPFAW